MRVIALEEHISFSELTSRIPEAAITARGWPATDSPNSPTKRVGSQLAEVGEKRLKTMDEAGITVQVLSVSGAGADLLDAGQGPILARDYNDALARRIAAYPNRFAGFAHLPMSNPEAAADELERTVTDLHFCGAMINGLTQNQFLDHPRFAPLLERAERLAVPLYLHPGVPPEAIQAVYYDGLAPALSTQLGMAGFGWHAETAIHVLRLVLSGTFERFHNLQLIIGHMGETLPVMMARCDLIFSQEMTHLPRTISQTLQQQVYITTSGIFTQPPLLAALATFGVDRILFSVDYPFSANEQGRAFLNSINLPPTDVEKIAHGNADRLLKLRA
ncbi:amidohydrolase family protein [Spirosoma jeollabukense]